MVSPNSTTTPLDNMSAPAKSCGQIRRTVSADVLLHFATVLFVFSAIDIRISSAQTDDPRAEVKSAFIEVEASAGWDGLVDQSTPVPVSLLLTNYSDRQIEATLTLNDPINGYEVSLGEVFLGPNATRRLTSIQSLTDWFECYATLRTDDTLLWRQELQLTTGREFDSWHRFALFIDDTGRGPPAVVGNQKSYPLQTQGHVVAGPDGRPVEWVTVKTWQVPNHFGPLMMAQAVVFPEDADADALNPAQWGAIAGWMCQGGIVFVSSASDEVAEALTRASPLQPEPRADNVAADLQRIGLGALYRYQEPLYAPDNQAVRGSLAAMISQRPDRAALVSNLATSATVGFSRNGRADANRVLVIVVFTFYALLSGPVPLLMFRWSRRRVAVYLGSLVLTACLLSGVLGGFLRFSEGDLTWSTVTKLGAGGAVQVGNLTVQSAGGRNTQMCVQGRFPDLQFTGTDQGYSTWMWRTRWDSEYPAFTWQPSLARGESDRYQIQVPMTPWGRRKLLATEFCPGLPQLEFTLQPAEVASAAESEATPGSDAESNGIAGGRFTLRLVNSLPYTITDCWLVIGTTTDGAAIPTNRRSVVPRGFVQDVPQQDSGLVDVYSNHRLSDLAAGSTLTEVIDARFERQEDAWEFSRDIGRGQVRVPRISAVTGATAWLIGRVADSPSLRIDSAGSDFMERGSLHVIVQEIDPEQFPDALRNVRPPAEQPR